ncbi:MAG: hypothetical protein ABI857_06200 [Acidobacteriota bacterium]
MKSSSNLVIEGVVLAEPGGGPVAGVVVTARSAKSKRSAARSTSDSLGRFTMSLAVGTGVTLTSTERLIFAVSRSSEGRPFHSFDPIGLSKLGGQPLRLEIPEHVMVRSFGKPEVEILLDGNPGRRISVGQSIAIRGRQLRPASTYQLSFSIGRGSKARGFDQSVATDAFGRVERTVVWPQFGLSSLEELRELTIAEARKAYGGQTVSWELRDGRRSAASGSLSVERSSKEAVVFVSNKKGELRNAIEAGRDPLLLAGTNLPKGDLRIILLPRRDDWVIGDEIRPARDAAGRDLAFNVTTENPEGTIRVASAGRIPPGAYDLVLRPMRYGFEADQIMRLQDRDIVVGRGFTGLVVREDFWKAKPVLGGCVNAFPMSGSPVSGSPYFRYRDTFAVGENVWAAMDPGIVMPGQIGKKIELNVVASKTAAQWGASTALAHVAPVGPLQLVLQSGCINANKQLIWPSANQVGTFDIVADFGNNDPNPASFMPDGNFNTPVDMIDGYFVPGFRVVPDPGTMSEWANVGAFAIDSAFLSGFGIGASMTVQDEDNAYFTPGGFTAVSESIPRLAIVRFPADVAGATQPSQISAVRPNYPLFVVVHGNGHTYTNYAFLLEHMARNGFISVSIHLTSNRKGLGRANAFFDHINTINTVFGSSVQNNVAVLGHSRGGEAVFKIARLNESLALGIGVNALIALGPTDQYGRETITGTTAKPVFVLYGAKDDDVSGWPPYAGYNVRQSGFTLYDRFDGKEKSMAFVYNATHNGFVTHNEAFGAPPVPPLMTVPDQQKILLAYCNAFCRMHVQGEPQWRGMFTGEWTPPTVSATGAVITMQFRDPTRRTLDEFEGPHAAGDWQTSTIGAPVVQSGLPSDPVETQLYPQDNQSPHDTGGLRVTWNSNGDQLVFDIPAAQRNVTGFSHLQVRLGKVVNSASNPAGAQNFRIALRDGAGNERLIRASAFGGVPESAAGNEVGNNKSSLSTLRIPLTAYTVVCAGAVQVDLTDVVQAKLVFSEIATGEIAVDELEFTN